MGEAVEDLLVSSNSSWVRAVKSASRRTRSISAPRDSTISVFDAGAAHSGDRFGPGWRAPRGGASDECPGQGYPPLGMGRHVRRRQSEFTFDDALANVSSSMEEPLGRQLAITGRVVRKRFDCSLGNHGSSLATWAVLRGADDEDGLSQRALAARIGIESPTLVRHLDRMEREGLIERTRDEHDRRVVRVSLTLAGRRSYKALRRVAEKLDAQLRSLLSPHEIETLEDVLPRIRDRWHPDETPDGR